MKKPSLWHSFLLVALASIVIILDQYTKGLVRANLPLLVDWNPIAWLEPIVTLTHIHNTGVAFGLFPGLGKLFVVVPTLVIIGLIVFFRRLASQSWLLTMALGLQLGGAAGNLIDRVARGYVTDFVNFRVWPVFNVADSSIVVGSLLLGIFIIFFDDSEAVEENQVAASGAQPE